MVTDGDVVEVVVGVVVADGVPEDGEVGVDVVLTPGADEPAEDEPSVARIDTGTMAAAGRLATGTVSTTTGGTTAMVVSAARVATVTGTVVVGTVIGGLAMGVGAFSHTERGVAEPRLGKSVSRTAQAAPTAARHVPRTMTNRVA